MALAYCGDLCVGWAGLVCTGTAVISLLIHDIRSSCARAPFVVAQSFGRCIAQNTIGCALAMVVAQRIQSLSSLVVLGQYGPICRYSSISLHISPSPLSYMAF